MSSVPSFNLIWTANGQIETESAYFEIGYPGISPNPMLVTVQSSALQQKTYNTLTNVTLYLTGESRSLQIVQELWPGLGGSFYPPREELNGGIEISFDGGKNFNRFSTSYGYEKDPSTWVTLPAESIGLSGQDGRLLAVETASLQIRYIVPVGAVDFQKIKVALALDFDII